MLQSTRELYLTFSLGLPLEWAPGKLRIWELFKIMVLQDINVIWSKSFLPVGCTNAREIRQRLHVGLPGPHSLSLERAPPPVLTRLLGYRRPLLEAVYSKSQTALGSHC